MAGRDGLGHKGGNFVIYGLIGGLFCYQGWFEYVDGIVVYVK